MKQHLLYLRTGLPINLAMISLYFWVLSDKSAQALEAGRACILSGDKRAPLVKSSVAAGLEVDAS